jgi:hypothetical protein
MRKKRFLARHKHGASQGTYKGRKAPVPPGIFFSCPEIDGINIFNYDLKQFRTFMRPAVRSFIGVDSPHMRHILG